jgi:hypothetical protein
MTNKLMTKGSTLFLKGVIYIMGAGVLVLCLYVLPLGITTDRVGYYKPILIGMYFPGIPFFIALYQALKLLSLIDKNKTFSEQSVSALKYIKYCGLAISGMYALGMPYIFYAADRDDAPGVVLIGLVIVFSSFVIATAAALFQSLLQSAVDLKSENDLTV